MRRVRRSFVVVIIAALALMALTACSQQTETEKSAGQQVEEQVEEQSGQSQQAVDDALNAAQDQVDELAAAVGGLEARISGLQIKSDLQEIQRKLTNAIDGAADKKVDAIEELSASFNNLIYRVNLAAGKLPEGGPVRVELEDFSKQLTSIQSDLADAAASIEASSTP